VCAPQPIHAHMSPDWARLHPHILTPTAAGHGTLAAAALPLHRIRPPTRRRNATVTAPSELCRAVPLAAAGSISTWGGLAGGRQGHPGAARRRRAEARSGERSGEARSQIQLVTVKKEVVDRQRGLGVNRMVQR
jgi:hypothetical protein